MDGVFTTEERSTVTVEIVGEIYHEQSPLTIERVREIAKSKGIVNFTLSDGDGDALYPNDFNNGGYTGTYVKITQYNEAKSL